MFEFLRGGMSDAKQHPDHPNVYYAVSNDEIIAAEKRLGFEFPPQLRAFFQEIGSGFLKAPRGDVSRRNVNYVNRFLGPGEVADLYLGEAEELAPTEGFGEGELPFFEIGDQLYLVICPTRDLPNQVCWPFGDPVAPDLVTFARRLAEDPRFYHK